MKTFLINFFPKYYKTKKFKVINNATLESLKKEKKIEPELLLLNKFVKTNDYCFDIGANKGHYTYKLESLSKSKNIYAFDPIHENYIFLNKIFPNCKIYKYAISDKSINTQFKIPIVKKKLIHTRGKLNFDIVEKNEDGYQSIDVECKTLDWFIEKEKINKLNFIKIDVEGSELKILHGGKKSIKKLKPIMLIEIEQRHHKVNIDEIFNYILNLGYNMKFYDLMNSEFKPISKFSVAQHQNYSKIKSSEYINNFFCIPK